MSARKTHVAFIINSLVGGGAERALINIITGLEDDLRSCRVSLVLLDDLPECHQVPSFVEKHVLDSRENQKSSIIKLTMLMRSLKPDVAVSFLARSNCANIVASKVAGYRAIISERVHTTNHFKANARAKVQKAIIRLCYPLADRVLAVSSGVQRDLVANFGVKPSHVAVIHNPVDLAKLAHLSKQPFSAVDLSGPYIVAVGRLMPNKNFTMMLRAFAASAVAGRLLIMGEGPERPALEALVIELGLSGRVIMAGYVANPFPALAGARYLVSSSNAEGFPNALVEAMALGCPVIATDCEAGPADILSPDKDPSKTAVTVGAYGVLVPVERPDLLAEAMKMYEDDALRAAFAKKGKDRVLHYAPEKVSKLYWQAISAQIPALTGGVDRPITPSAPSRSVSR